MICISKSRESHIIHRWLGSRGPPRGATHCRGASASLVPIIQDDAQLWPSLNEAAESTMHVFTNFPHGYHLSTHFLRKQPRDHLFCGWTISDSASSQVNSGKQCRNSEQRFSLTNKGDVVLLLTLEGHTLRAETSVKTTKADRKKMKPWPSRSAPKGKPFECEVWFRFIMAEGNHRGFLTGMKHELVKGMEWQHRATTFCQGRTQWSHISWHCPRFCCFLK